MTRFALIAASFLALGSYAMAQTSDTKTETKTEAKSGCCAGAEKASCSKDAKGGEGCSKGAVAVSMPKMQYKVGDQTVCCPTQAGELAKGDKSKIKFVVADKTYENEGEATDAYAKVLDGFLGEVTTVKYAVGDSCVACPDEAAAVAKKENKKVTYRLASFNFESKEAAEKAAASAKQAAEKVEMKMMVGKECFACPMSAGEAAKKDGKSVEYVVGESKTCCDKTAKVNLAKARIEAAIGALSSSPGIAKA